MKSIFKKSVPTEIVVFKATIELNSDEYRGQLNSNSNSHYNSYRLKPDNKYWFSKKEKEVTYKELQYVLVKTIKAELLQEINERLEDKLALNVKVISVNKGSIEIIFSVLLYAGGAVLSGIIYDLVKYTVKNLLAQELLDNYGDFFDVDVMVTSPLIGITPSIMRRSYEERGAFFYYLLYSNFFLMGILFGIVLAVIFHLIR